MQRDSMLTLWRMLLTDWLLSGIWAGAIKEVQQQAAILEAQTLALAKIARIDRVLLHGTM